MSGRVRGPAPAGGLAVRCEELVHIYRTGDLDVVAVRGVDLVVERGERLALLGPSGSGKSTLLGMLGGLIPPSAGQVWVGDEEIGGLPERALLRLRAQRVGVVLQGAARNLLPYATPAENVRFAQRSLPRARRREAMRPTDLLEALGLGAVADRPVPLLSGSAWRSRSPSRTARDSCSPTSRRRSSTTRPATRCSTCSTSSTSASGRRSWWSRTTPRSAGGSVER
jgi:ABC-type lipopolysaccharide export system ATPase subunit